MELPRPVGPDDTDAVAAVYAPHVTDSYASFELVAPTGAAILARSAGLPFYVVGALGFAYASPHRARAAYRWAVDVSVYLAPEATGRGLGRALYDRLLPTLAELGYLRAYAGIALPNQPSVGLHEALGFDCVGIYESVGFKLGAWRDVGWWGRALGEALSDPAEPRAWDGVT